MKVFVRFLGCCISICFTFLCTAQSTESAVTQYTFGSINYGFYVPLGDLPTRFGENSMVGIAVSRKTNKNHVFSLESSLIFGNQVYEPGLLQNLFSEYGEVFDEQSQVAEILPLQRGYTIYLSAGHIFPFQSANPNSGLFLKGGIGFMQHKIRVEHQNNRVPQLEGEYLKGYDRLTNGLAINQFIGYMHFSKNRLANFYIGVDLQEGFTRGRRSWNYDTQTSGNDKRFDMMAGLKAGWCILFYKRMANDYYIR